MNFWKFTLFTLAGTTLFAALLCLPGYFMGENWGVVVGYIEEYERVILALLLILFLLYIRKGVRDFIKERNSTKKDS